MQFNISVKEAVVAHGLKGVTVTQRLWVQSALEEMKYLFKFIFPFLRSGVKAKHRVEFRHSTCNASKIWRKVGNSVLTFPLPALLCAGYSVKLKISLIFLSLVLTMKGIVEITTLMWKYVFFVLKLFT